MAEYQRRVGSDVMVVTVHQDENETAALLRLAELGVRLPTLQDGRRQVGADQDRRCSVPGCGLVAVLSFAVTSPSSRPSRRLRSVCASLI